MKPDDILNAIGDVEEKYVKRAHRRDLLKALAWFFGTLAVLTVITGSRIVPDYILSRINPDFTVNTGYVEPEHLEKDSWTSMEYTAYEKGMETAKTVFRRSLFDNYTVVHTTAAGEKTVLIGGGEASAKEYIGELDMDALYMETYYSEDLIGRIDSMFIGSRFAHETPYEPLNFLRMEYLESLYLVKEIRYSGKEDLKPLGWRSFSYANSRLSAAKDYDGEGNLLGYTEYTYEGNERRAESYTSAGVLTGSTNTRYDWFGNIRERTYYDAGGNLTGREIYRYRFWERYVSMEGLFALMLSLSLAATMGIASWEERLRLPRRKESGSLAQARAGLRQARQVVDGMEKTEREVLACEVRALLERLENKEE